MNEKFQASAKITAKMTKDGVVERNAVTGEDKRVSKRTADFDIRGSDTTPAYSQIGNTPTTASKSHKQAIPNELKVSEQIPSSTANAISKPNDTDVKISPTYSQVGNTNAASENKRPRLHKPLYTRAAQIPVAETLIQPQTNTNLQPKLQQSETPLKFDKLESVLQHKRENPLQTSERIAAERIAKRDNSISASDDKTQLSAQQKRKLYAKSAAPKRDENLSEIQSAVVSDNATNAIPTQKGNSKIQIDRDNSPQTEQPKQSKRQQTAEKAINAKHETKLQTAQKRYDSANEKLEAAKSKLPTKKKLKKQRIYDEQKNKARTKLTFETQIKSKAEHLKGGIPQQAGRLVGNGISGIAHTKVYQVEHENVSVKAAHRAEIAAEGAVRSALHFHKTAPYRKVAKLEKLTEKAEVNLRYEKLLKENPGIRKNPIAKAFQKRKIKRDYAKAAYKAKKQAAALKETGGFAAKASQAVAEFIKKNPYILAVIGILLIVIILISIGFSFLSAFGNGGLGGILAAAYTAEDEDINNAELRYSELETDLAIDIENTPSTHSGYDHYVYNIGTIGHDPYKLLAYLTAKYRDFKFNDVKSELQSIFDEQYELSYSVTTVTHHSTDSEGNEHTYTETTLTTTLTVKPFSDILADRMDSDQTEQYGVLNETHGLRQYVTNPVDFDWTNAVTCYFGWRVHPTTGEKNMHKGVDIAMSEGTPLYAGFDGTVTNVGYEAGGYGNFVRIGDGKGLEERFAHCSEIVLSNGQTFKKGDIVAYSGNTGLSTGPHLHFEVIKDGVEINPEFFAESEVN
ncbi:peptidase M24 [Clostridia bacterium]|nr:peptidase M24 [Clostridia bacterium]